MTKPADEKIATSPAETAPPGPGSSTVAGAGGTDDSGAATSLPVAARDVVQAEPSAAGPAAGTRSRLAAWLFRPDTPAREIDLADLPAIVAADENFAWIDLSAYAESELRDLAGMLGLQEIGVRAALGPWQRPRLDVFGDHFFVTATVAHLDPEAYRVRAHQLDLFVGRNFLLSVHKRPLPFAERILARARQSPELVRLDSAFMLYIVLDQLIEYYEDLGERVDDEIEQMEERALTDTSDTFLSTLLHFKRYVFALSRLADQHRAVFAAFLRADFPFVADERVEPYYRDLETRLDRLRDTLLPAKEAVNGAFDIYVSHVSHRTNQVMKVLTLVSTLVLPATLILGFFGTNFEGVPLYQPAAFWVMIASIAAVTVVIVSLFRRRGWF